MSGDQERSEQPTPKRLREAAQKGQVARSRELTTLAMLGLGGVGLLLFGPWMMQGLLGQMRAGLAPPPGTGPALLGAALLDMLWRLAPFLALMLAVAVAAPLALGGWSASAQALSFKPERVSPLQGVKRLFSLNALVELLKALAKFVIIGAAAVGLLWLQTDELLRLANLALPPALAQAGDLTVKFLLLLTLPLVLIAALDVPFQLHQHAKNLRMTKQEVKDELKQTDGRPEVKGRIRRLQMEYAQRRMMEQVPDADVVVVNPAHFAVALRYRQDKAEAPTVVAKGTDQLAQRIRELAGRHRVPLVAAPLLARALYFNAELDRPIPASLYRAVAQVLAYVYQLGAEGRTPAEPVAMEDLPVPEHLRVD